jgi:hypothetical protein
MRTILVFQNGELIMQIGYKTKASAKKQYSHFLKKGILDHLTGEKIENATFELV